MTPIKEIVEKLFEILNKKDVLNILTDEEIKDIESMKTEYYAQII